MPNVTVSLSFWEGAVGSVGSETETLETELTAARFRCKYHAVAVVGAMPVRSRIPLVAHPLPADAGATGAVASTLVAHGL